MIQGPPHVGADINAGLTTLRSALSTPPVTSSRISTQPATRHSRRGRTGWERHGVEADGDESGSRAQPATDCVARRCSPAPSLAPFMCPCQVTKTQLTVHISTNDLHCWKLAHSQRRAAPGGRPRRRPPRRRNPPRHDHFCF